jgi:broad specificity phosphatase PhoE
LQGTADVPLSEAGRAQAERLAAELRPVRLDAAYTSPLLRARDTAAAVCADRRIAVQILFDLHELSYGSWQGRDAAGCEADDPALYRAWRADPWSVTFPAGESLHGVDARARRALAWVTHTHPGGTVLVSAHGHLNRVLLIAVHGWPRGRFWELEQSNACCTMLDVAPAAFGPRLGSAS